MHQLRRKDIFTSSSLWLGLFLDCHVHYYFIYLNYPSDQQIIILNDFILKSSTVAKYEWYKRYMHHLRTKIDISTSSSLFLIVKYIVILYLIIHQLYKWYYFNNFIFESSTVAKYKWYKGYMHQLRMDTFSSALWLDSIFDCQCFLFASKYHIYKYYSNNFSKFLKEK